MQQIYEAKVITLMKQWNEWLRRRIRMYMETMEDAKNKGGKPEEIGYARMAGLPKRKHSERRLGQPPTRFRHFFRIKNHHSKRPQLTV